MISGHTFVIDHILLQLIIPTFVVVIYWHNFRSSLMTDQFSSLMTDHKWAYNVTFLNDQLPNDHIIMWPANNTTASCDELVRNQMMLRLQKLSQLLSWLTSLSPASYIFVIFSIFHGTNQGTHFRITYFIFIAFYHSGGYHNVIHIAFLWIVSSFCMFDVFLFRSAYFTVI